MKLKDLERLIRLAIAGDPRPKLAAVAESGVINEAFDSEFADAVRTLSYRAKKPGTKPDDPTNWT